MMSNEEEAGSLAGGMRSRDTRWKRRVKVLLVWLCRCDGGAAAVMRRANPVLTPGCE